MHKDCWTGSNGGGTAPPSKPVALPDTVRQVGISLLGNVRAQQLLKLLLSCRDPEGEEPALPLASSTAVPPLGAGKRRAGGLRRA